MSTCDNVSKYIYHLIYLSPLSAEDDSAAPEVGVAGDTNHTHSDGTFDVSSAMKLIHHSGGRSVSAKAHSSSNDGYFAFLLLRHLRIREERHKVRPGVIVN